MTQEKNDCQVEEFSSRVCYLGTKSCETKHIADDPLIECKCGKKWWIDYTPTPEGCEYDVWRIWVNGESGRWMDVDGNLVKD